MADFAGDFFFRVQFFFDPAGLADAKNPELIFFPDGILKSRRSFHFIAVFFLLLTNLILMRKKNYTGYRRFLRFFFS